MRITTLHKETKLADVVDRLFANLTPATRRIAEKAIMEANPELFKAEVLQPSSIIRVPEVPGLKLKAARREDDPVGQTREILKESLRGYGKALVDRLGTEKAELDGQVGLLEEILRKRDSPLDEKVTTMTNALKQNLEKRLKENEVRGDVVLRALARALNDL